MDIHWWQHEVVISDLNQFNVWIQSHHRQIDGIVSHLHMAMVHGAQAPTNWHYNAFAVCLNLLVLGLAMRGTWLITHCYDTPETLRFSSLVRQILILQWNICDLLLSVVNLRPWCLGKKNRVASGTLLEFAEDLPQRPQLKWSDLSTDDVEHGSRCQASIFTTSM